MEFPLFCEQVGLRLEQFQKRIARAAGGNERELVVLLPRGQGKTTLMAALALHHLITTDGAEVYVAASARSQARILFEAAVQFALRLEDDAWQQCVGQPAFTDGEPIWVGVDVGGDKSASAVIWINGAHHVGCEIFHGDAGVLDCIDVIRELAGRYELREVMYDPWRFGQAAQELAQERVIVTAFPQTDVRMVPASDGLYQAVVQKRLTLPDNPELRQHMSNTIARHNRRGWRLDKPSLEQSNDSIIALCMALEAMENQPEPVRVLGWL